MPVRRNAIPRTQWAVQVTGPGRLVLEKRKAVPAVGPFHILARVEAVGLCFSDLKLIRLFDEHPRKGPVTGGVEPEILSALPSYVPGDKPTVPGHEAVCRIVSVGSEVRRHAVGERVLVQTDYRALATAGSNAAFGYNFEGALQEYVLFDERIVIDGETGERFLIPVGEELSASAVALVEPWACVESSYATANRRGPRPDGRMLVVADARRKVIGLDETVGLLGRPCVIFALCKEANQEMAVREIGVQTRTASTTAELEDGSFDDVIYYGSDPATVEALETRLASGGIINVVTGGARIARPVKVGVGRVHYSGTRWVGTTSENALRSYASIPHSGETRPGDRVAIIGAAGPMGQMHVIRSLATAPEGTEIIAVDLDASRLAGLEQKCRALSRQRGIPVRLVDASKEGFPEKCTYVTVLAPSPALVAEAVEKAGKGCLVNVFAGISVETRQPLDLQRYIENECFMFGTSGSTIADMKKVLSALEAGRVDTNLSVEAVSGLSGAIEALEDIGRHTFSGKVVVYPALRELDVVALSKMPQDLPAAAARLEGGVWCKGAEEALLAGGC